jgi:hypothetical protein
MVFVRGGDFLRQSPVQRIGLGIQQKEKYFRCLPFDYPGVAPPILDAKYFMAKELWWVDLRKYMILKNRFSGRCDFIGVPCIRTMKISDS